MQYQLGIGTGMGLSLPVAKQLPLIKKTGFDAFFTGWKADAPIANWADAAKRLGLIYQSVHAPFSKVNEIWKGSEEGREMVNTLKRCLYDCATYSVPLMIIHPFIGFHDHTPTEIGIEWYAEIVQEAENCGVLLGFENVEGMEYLKALMDTFCTSPAAKFCYDSGHEQCYNYGIDQLALYGDRLAGTHLNDNLGIANRENINWTDDLHLLPFDGTIHWKAVMDRLRAVHYTGILTFELTVKSKPGRHENDSYAAMTPEDYLKEAYRRAVNVAGL